MKCFRARASFVKPTWCQSCFTEGQKLFSPYPYLLIDVVEFSIEALQLMPLSSREFCGSWCSEKPYFTWGLSENFVHILYIFHPVWVKVGIRDVYRKHIDLFGVL